MISASLLALTKEIQRRKISISTLSFPEEADLFSTFSSDLPA
jgi:hypothetical protein